MYAEEEDFDGDKLLLKRFAAGDISIGKEEENLECDGKKGREGSE